MTSPTAPAEKWVVVLRADGVVDSVEGGAPVTWLGRRLEEEGTASEPLRRATSLLVHAAPSSVVRRSEVSVIERGKTVHVELIIVEALPVRRALVSVRDLVMRTLDFFVTQAQSSEIDLAFDLDANVPPAIFVDAEKISWALSMLVSNALRFAKKHVFVHVRFAAGDNDLILDVRDDGTGIPEPRARTLFERDPTTGRAAGLALLMVKDIVSSHRGSVDVSSGRGQGTTFTLRIPRVPH